MLRLFRLTWTGFERGFIYIWIWRLFERLPACRQLDLPAGSNGDLSPHKTVGGFAMIRSKSQWSLKYRFYAFRWRHIRKFSASHFMLECTRNYEPLECL